MAQTVKNLPAVWETWVLSLGWEDLPEKAMGTHASILAWRIPRTEQPGGLQSLPSCFSRIRLFATPWTVARQAPLFVGFSRQDYWTGLPLPPLGGLSKAGIEPKSLQADSLPFEPSGKLTQSRGCSSWGCQVSDKTEQLSMQAVLREVSSCTPRPPFVSLLSSTLPTPVMGLN